MTVYKYRLHDPDSGKVLYEGTAADLAAQGVVVSEKVLPTLWRDQQRQHKRRGKHRWDITREKVEVACSRKAYKVRLKPKKTAAVQAKPPKRPAKPKAAALPVPKPVAPRAPRVRLKKYLTDPTPLQRDVRELEGYNAKARERGKKELSYGYWAAEGNRLLRHGKAGMHAGLPGPAPSLQRPVRKIPGLESRGTERKDLHEEPERCGKDQPERL